MSSNNSRKSLTQDGSEILDSKPMEIPVGFTRPPSLQEQVQRLIRTEMSQQAHGRGEETFEESEYFGEDDDMDPSSPYELEYHAGTNKEVTRQEMEHIRAGEREFDRKYSEYKRAKDKEKAEYDEARKKAFKRRQLARKKKAARQ